MMDYGWFSLLPSAVAVVMAIVSRRVILSLAAAIAVGAGLLAWPQASAAGPDATVQQFFGISFDHLWASADNWQHQQVLIFSLLLGAMVGVIEAGGSMRALIALLTRRIHGRRGAQSAVVGLGFAVFFDDYANSLLLGGTMRSLCDSLRISRAKLAYLVDSTAAPVAGLALISTWVATEISLLGDGLALAGAADQMTPFSLFLASIPYRFYAFLALILALTVAVSGRDFGPMLAAERQTLREPIAVEVQGSEDDGPAVGGLWWAAVLPVAICVLAVIAVLIGTGAGWSLRALAADTGDLKGWGQLIGNGNSYLALMVGGAIGLALAIALRLWFGGSSLRLLAIGALRGAWQITPAMVVLWLAWSLSAMTTADYLNTGGFLASRLQSGMPVWLLPTAVFLVAGGVAFSTGTSWGTMAILTPLSVQLAVQMGDGRADGAIVLATAGSVLAGAIFGDHCSPISDTTVLSSRASGCDHVLHVRTQLPYALLGGLLAVLCGTLPAALGLSPWLCIALGAAATVAAVRIIGRDATASPM